jgi:pimeloyl-ACP methyl ester carboxylesterase
VIPVTALAQPPADWISAPDASAEYAAESVFGGHVALFRAGPSDGEPVVLVHGLGRNAARDWEKTIPALAQRYAVYALDLPGFGYSDKGNHLYSPQNFARVLEAVLAGRVQRPFTLIGHSMGGAVALAYAAAYPQRVRRLVVVDAAGVLHRSVYAEFLGRMAAQRAIGMDSPWFDDVMRAIQLRAENWPIHADLVLERAGVRRRFFGGDPNAIAAVALAEHDFSQALRAIRAPTLVIWGAQDTIAPLRTGQALASAIRGARLVVLEGVAHAPQIETPSASTRSCWRRSTAASSPRRRMRCRKAIRKARGTAAAAPRAAPSSPATTSASCSTIARTRASPMRASAICRWPTRRCRSSTRTCARASTRATRAWS